MIQLPPSLRLHSGDLDLTLDELRQADQEIRLALEICSDDRIKSDLRVLLIMAGDLIARTTN